jgi:predicted RNA-binding protein YlxR (DUF448 family)
LRKIPLRTCLGCGEQKPKKELIRVVKDKEGNFSVDFTGKKNGRGAYICKNIGCFAKAKQKKRFEKAFDCQIPEEIYLSLEGEFKENE